MPAWVWVLCGWAAISAATAFAVAWALRRGLIRFELRGRGR